MSDQHIAPSSSLIGRPSKSDYGPKLEGSTVADNARCFHGETCGSPHVIIANCPIPGDASVEQPASFLFRADDAADEPTVWLFRPDRPDYPVALLRKCDIEPTGRELLWAAIERAVRGR